MFSRRIRSLAAPSVFLALLFPFVLPGQSPQLLHTFEGQSAGDRHGFSVADAGDLDGDGRNDCVVGEPGYDAGAGRVRVFSGRTGAVLLAVTGAPGDGLGHSVAGGGDVDGDGGPDIAAGNAGAPPNDYVRVFRGADGAVLHSFWSFERLGLTLENHQLALSDIDLDGRADCVVGEPNYHPGLYSGQGRVRVYSGATGGVLFEALGPWDDWDGGDYFGMSVAVAGDTDGDGWPDILVGAPDPGGQRSSTSGSAWVYSGRDGSLLRHIPAPAGIEFGEAVSAAGDVDHDGFADYIVGAGREFDGWNPVHVFSGQTGAVLYRFTTPVQFSSFGHSVSGGGDVDGDGWPDIAVGSHYDPTGGPGKVYVYSGQTGSLLFAVTGGPETDDFGLSTSLVGDTNGDGRSDLLVGAWRSGSQGTEYGRSELYGYFNPDQDPPDVRILAPADGSITPLSAVDLELRISDASPTRVSVPAAAFQTTLPAGSDIPLSVSVPLPADGLHPIAISVVDAADNTTNRTVTVRRDATPPVISIDTPTEGAVLGTTTVLVSVTIVDDTAVTFTVNGVATTTSPITVTLDQGAQRIEVAATDAAGNRSVAVRNVYIDLSAPRVDILTPDPAAGTPCYGPSDSTFRLEARVADDSVATVTSLPPGLAGSAAPPEDVVSADVSLWHNGSPVLQEGDNVVRVFAIDQANNSGEASVTVRWDSTPPCLDILSPPANGAVGGTDVELGVRAVDPSPGSGVTGVVLWLDGQQIATLSTAVDNVFSHHLDSTTLADGLHSLVVEAEDGKGNSARSSERWFLVDNTPPAVVIANPADQATVTGVVAFDVMASDGGSGVTGVVLTAAGQPPSPTDPSFLDEPPAGSVMLNASVDTTQFPDGALLLSAWAVDAAGSRSEPVTSQVTVNNTVPPTCELTPLDGSTVSGTVDLVASVAGTFETVGLRIDGTAYGSPTTSPTLALPYDTTTRLDGDMVVEAVVTYSSGRTVICRNLLTIDNISLSFAPTAVNLRSKGAGPITATLEGPSVPLLMPIGDHGLQLRLYGGSPVAADATWAGSATLTDSDGDLVPELRVRFSRSEVIGAILAGLACGSIQGGDVVKLDVWAETGSGGALLGSTFVKIVGRR